MKANYQQQNRPSRVIQNKISRPVTQKMAWVASRPLGQQEINGNIVNNVQPLNSIGIPIFNPRGHRTENSNFGNLSLHHRHIIFSNYQYLPIGEYNNIGFHCTNGRIYGNGDLFQENTSNLGYRMLMQITNNNNEDENLVAAIWRNYPPGNYNLFTHNCQDWVTQVINTYNNL